jgi:hypothetical protein
MAIIYSKFWKKLMNQEPKAVEYFFKNNLYKNLEPVVIVDIPQEFEEKKNLKIQEKKKKKKRKNKTKNEHSINKSYDSVEKSIIIL